MNNTDTIRMVNKQLNESVQRLQKEIRSYEIDILPHKDQLLFEKDKKIASRDEFIIELLQLVKDAYGVTSTMEYRERAEAIGIKL